MPWQVRHDMEEQLQQRRHLQQLARVCLLLCSLANAPFSSAWLDAHGACGLDARSHNIRHPNWITVPQGQCKHHAVQREYEAERQAVDEIMRKIDEEDAADAAKRAAQQAATRAYIAEFLKQQARCPGTLWTLWTKLLHSCGVDKVRLTAAMLPAKPCRDSILADMHPSGCSCHAGGATCGGGRSDRPGGARD